MKARRYISLLELMERLGVRLSLDWDGELLYEMPDSIQVETLERVIRDEPEAFKTALECRRQRDLTRLNGGPMDGRLHSSCYPFHVVYRIKRAHWAAYHIQQDGRGFFRGFATSKVKAKRLARQASAIES